MPPNCDLSQTADCQDCRDDCECGCRRTTDCRLNKDYLCQKSAGYDENCYPDGCITNAEFNDETQTCECLSPNFYQVDVDVCEPCILEGCDECDLSVTCLVCSDGYYMDTETSICLACDGRCAICTDGTNTSCSLCSDDNYLTPGTTICESYCPSALGKENGECQEFPEQSICYTFQDKSFYLEAQGVRIDKHDSLEAPFPLWARGMYFNGNAALLIPDLILNTSFTLEFIVRPEDGGQLFCITNLLDENVLAVVLQNFQLQLIQHDLPPHQHGTVELGIWYNLAVSVSRLDVKLYIHGVQVGGDHTLAELVIDSPNNIHSLGLDFTGMMYKACVHQFASKAFDLTLPVNCAFNEFIANEDQCYPCMEECSFGCMRPTDCRQCIDHLCEDCETWAVGSCSSCIENAELVDQVCSCDDPYNYMEDMGACDTC